MSANISCKEPVAPLLAIQRRRTLVATTKVLLYPAADGWTAHNVAVYRTCSLA